MDPGWGARISYGGRGAGPLPPPPLTLASLDWRTDKKSVCLLVLRSCFYDAEHVLSVIAKFLVHHLGEGEGQG